MIRDPHSSSNVAPPGDPDGSTLHGIPQWHIAPGPQVAQRIAHAVLDGAPPVNPTLGAIQLAPHQNDAVVRLRLAMVQYGGALLADEVGLGKTFVALALARDYQHTCLIAPAALRTMWTNALRSTASSGVSLRSLQGLSGRRYVAPELPPDALVIIDEAHHLRTRHSIRYRRAAQLTAGRDVLLLTATPLHNTTAELRALLALFLGDRADALDAHTLAALVVRRTHLEVPSARLPAVVEHTPWTVPENSPVLEALLTLPPPLPARHGVAAGALVRLGLLRAWCSSDAALTDVLRRRRLRGEALLHALAHGRHPTRAELRTWTTGSDSVQLGFPELLVSTTVEAVDGAPARMLAQVTTHLSALDALERLHLRTAAADPVRGAHLRNLLREEPHTPVLAFSQFAATVNALYRALADVAGVASLTSHGGRVAGGPLTRQDVLQRFAPRAHERPPPPAHEAIRLLIATDVLSEGVNLQDAGKLVHLDFPWTDAARTQRVGRLARLGSMHREIQVYAMAPPPGADRTLHLVAALERKAGMAGQFVGRSTLAAASLRASDALHVDAPRASSSIGVHVASPSSAADDASRVRQVLQSWLQFTPAVDDETGIPVALIAATTSGWIAALQHGTQVHLAAVVAGNMSPASAAEDAFAPSMLRRTFDALCPPGLFFHAEPTHVDTRSVAVSRALSAAQSVLADLAIATLVGPTMHAVADVRRTLLDRIAHIIARCTSAHRSALLRSATQAERVVLGARGVGAESSLRQWGAVDAGGEPTRWLDGWRCYPDLAGSRLGHDEVSREEQSSPVHARLLAMLVLVPTDAPTTR